MLLTGLLARRMGGDRPAQLLAGAAMAVSAILLILGHLHARHVRPAVLDLISFLVVRQLQGADPRGWLVGLVTGIALHNKTLVAALVAAVLLELLAVGPRTVLRSAWLWAAPAWRYCGCRTCSGRPTTAAAHAGPRDRRRCSGSSQPWWLFLPMQLVLVSPVLVAMWLPGLVRLWRAAERPVRSRRRLRAAGPGVPALRRQAVLPGRAVPGAAGRRAPAVVGWLRNQAGVRGWVVGGLGLSLLVNAVLMLPVLPVRALAVRRSSTSTTTPGRPWAGPRSRPRWPGVCHHAAG